MVSSGYSIYQTHLSPVPQTLILPKEYPQRHNIYHALHRRTQFHTGLFLRNYCWFQLHICGLGQLVTLLVLKWRSKSAVIFNGIVYSKLKFGLLVPLITSLTSLFVSNPKDTTAYIFASPFAGPFVRKVPVRRLMHRLFTFSRDVFVSHFWSMLLSCIKFNATVRSLNARMASEIGVESWIV